MTKLVFASFALALVFYGLLWYFWKFFKSLSLSARYNPQLDCVEFKLQIRRIAFRPHILDRMK